MKLGSGMAIARRLAEITSANNNILEHIEILLEDSKRLAKNVEGLADIEAHTITNLIDRTYKGNR